MRSYVLLHGGQMTGAFWDRVVPLLDGPALAADLPGRRGKPGDLLTLTIEQEVKSVVADIEAAGIVGPIVVVAHSSGGLIVPGILSGLGAEIAHVVLNAASVPPEGGSGLDCMADKHRDRLDIALKANQTTGRALLTQGPPDDPESYRGSYGPPLSDDDLANVVYPDRCVIDTVSPFFEPVSWASTPPTRVTYVVNLLDKPLPAQLQREMAARLPTPPTLVELQCGHLPAVTEPHALAQIITSVATERP